MKHAIKLVSAGVFVMALAASSLAFGQETRMYRDGNSWVQEMTGDLGAAKHLRMKLAAGSVQIQGGAQASVSYVIHRRAYTSSEQQARQEFESNRINASLKGDTAWIVAEEGGRRKRCSDDFLVKVPRNIDVAKVETGGGNMNVTEIAGPVELESGGGNIHLDGIANDVKAETGGGTIDVGSVEGNVSLETGGGNIKIASAKGEIKAESGGGSLVVLSGLQGAVLETGGGSIRVDKCSGRVKATTGGGSVDLGEIGGSAQIETAAGSIRLTSAKGRVQAETGGGSIQLDGASSVQAETSAGGITVKLLSAADSRNNSTLETSAGDITVYLANDLPITIRAEIEVANGHTIRSDFSDLHISTEGGAWAKTVRAEGQLNGGGPVLKVRTNSGNVSFRRVSR